MIKFNEIKYKRPNYSYIKKRVNYLIEELKHSSSLDEFIKIVRKINKIQNYLEEEFEYADICNMRDGSVEFYQKEMEYWNKYKPKYDFLFNPYYKLCLNSKYQEELKSVLPPNFFNTINFWLKITSSSIIPLQIKDNELKLTYRNLVNEKVLYNNEEVSITIISKDFSSNDRSIRKKAHDAYNDFFLQRKNRLDNIYYEMINIRNEIAHTLGFSNYSEYSLYNLKRFDYNYSDIKIFRDNIKKYITPIYKKIINWKKEFLGINDLKYYDTIMFHEMPKLKFKDKLLLEEMIKCFSKIDKDLGTFYNSMLKNNYIDFETRNTKAKCNITNYLTESAMPVITGNIKGEYTDIVTIVHEFGHSYQKYNASLEDKNYIVSPFLKYPTFDIAEMFSIGMELITIEHVTNLFESGGSKYAFLKITDIISNLLYYCLVDEFQEIIYKEENLTKESIATIWLNITKAYGFAKINTEHENLKKGGYIYRQSHLFLNPFYFIDYALSYFGAIKLWQSSKEDLDLFRKMGRVASYYPFKELLHKFNISSPFIEKNVQELANFIDEKLNMYYNIL